MKKPKWAQQDLKTIAALDLLVLSPIGCASYLVYKHGGGTIASMRFFRGYFFVAGFDNSDTKLALGLYGLHVALGVAGIPVPHTKNPKLVLALVLVAL